MWAVFSFNLSCLGPTAALSAVPLVLPGIDCGLQGGGPTAG
eukprot:COSAG03_NODE_2191_length_3026_cov_7.622139_3_plen_41_part_00